MLLVISRLSFSSALMAADNGIFSEEQFDKRIQQYRTAEVSLLVTDSNDNPLTNVPVTIRQTERNEPVNAKIFPNLDKLKTAKMLCKDFERAALEKLHELPNIKGGNKRQRAVALKSGTDDLPVNTDESAYKPAYKKLAKNAYFGSNRSTANVTSENHKDHIGRGILMAIARYYMDS